MKSNTGKEVGANPSKAVFGAAGAFRGDRGRIAQEGSGMGVLLQFGTAALWSRDGWETSVPEAKGARIQFTGRVCVVPAGGIGQFQCYLGSREW